MALQNREVLIIDDDVNIRKLVRKVLEGSGLKVSEAEGVKQAFELAETRGPHAVITDLSMPDQDGFVFLEKRRVTSSLRRVPVMVLSALGDKKSIFRAMSMGANDYIVKPFQAKDLIQKLRKLLKDQDFSAFIYPEGERPEVVCTVPASILNVSEVGFLIEAPVKVASDTEIKVKSELLTKLRVPECHVRTSKLPGRPGFSGLYLNQVDVVAIPQDIAKHIRQTLRGK